MSNGWGGRINYTYSRLEDNQFGEGNFFSRNTADARMPTTSRPSTRSASSTCRTRSSISPIVELPFGEGKRWANSGVGSCHPRRLDGLVDHLVRERLPDRRCSANSNDLSASSAADAAGQPRHGRSRNRRRAATSASIGNWLDAADRLRRPGGVVRARHAAPRNRDDIRTPHRNNWDFVATKDVRFGGSDARCRSASRC